MAGGPDELNLYFSDYFKVDPGVLEQYGAFNISLLADLPLFIDPFLLFNSQTPEYAQLHDEMIRYLKFLRDKVASGPLAPGLIDALFRFPEIKENYLGFSIDSNDGRGLGKHFAVALHQNLHTVFRNFGDEKITQGSHLEKLCLFKTGVGKDNVSDFTCNLIQHYLLSYTERFAQKYVPASLRDKFAVRKVKFNYGTESWETGTFDLPRFGKSFVLLTPMDMLTKDDTWISGAGMVNEFEAIRLGKPSWHIFNAV
jgi:hypothetical protein